jgi:Fe-Mn family superoxide dismutase
MFELPKIRIPTTHSNPSLMQKQWKSTIPNITAAYTDNLNKALEGVDTNNASIEEILSEIDMNNMLLRNNAGGYYNHKLFWELLSPEKSEPNEALLKALETSFGSFESFKEAFSKAALSRFGSGWAWLCKKDDGSLEIISTGNQDNPLMPGTEGGSQYSDSMCGNMPTI